jgi:hypothetical protein
MTMLTDITTKHDVFAIWGCCARQARTHAALMRSVPNLTADCTRSRWPNQHSCGRSELDVVHLAVASRSPIHLVGSIGQSDPGKAACFAAHFSESEMPCILNRAKVPT